RCAAPERALEVARDALEPRRGQLDALDDGRRLAAAALLLAPEHDLRRAAEVDRPDGGHGHPGRRWSLADGNAALAEPVAERRRRARDGGQQLPAHDGARSGLAKRMR